MSKLETTINESADLAGIAADDPNGAVLFSNIPPVTFVALSTEASPAATFTVALNANG